MIEVKIDNQPLFLSREKAEQLHAELGKQLHPYPSRHPHGTGGWAANEAWNILNALRPGIIPDDVRMFLAGSFAGALERVAKDGAS